MISTHITLELSSYTYTGLNFPARFYSTVPLKQLSTIEATPLKFTSVSYSTVTTQIDAPRTPLAGCSLDSCSSLSKLHRVGQFLCCVKTLDRFKRNIIQTVE